MLMAFAVGSASAFTPTPMNCPKGGMCPAGQCAKDGGPRACNVDNCSAANCRSSKGQLAQPRKQTCSYMRCIDRCYQLGGGVKKGRASLGCAGVCSKKGCT
jgi:hypothetical protein